jgi:hypothetical protein
MSGKLFSHMPEVGKAKLAIAVLCVFVLYIIVVSVDAGTESGWGRGVFAIGLFGVLLYVSGLPQYAMISFAQKNVPKSM